MVMQFDRFQTSAMRCCCMCPCICAQTDPGVRGTCHEFATGGGGATIIHTASVLVPERMCYV